MKPRRIKSARQYAFFTTRLMGLLKERRLSIITMPRYLTSFRFGRTASLSLSVVLLPVLRSSIVITLYMANDYRQLPRTCPTSKLPDVSNVSCTSVFLYVAVYLRVQFHIVGMRLNSTVTDGAIMSVMSLIYSRNNRGPIQLSWITPLL